MKEEAREILIEHGNGVWYASAVGDKRLSALLKDHMRVHYLFGVINNSETVTAEVMSAMEKLRHYNGRFHAVDLDAIGTDPTTPPTPSGDLASMVRVGHKAVTKGTTSVTFSSALPSTDYTINVWVKGTGESQWDVGVVTQSTVGFTVSDIVIDGTLYYQAIMNQ